ncbi:MAG: phosphomethylpyrimidine synthase ThiC, partial [Planctomycetota bacterium]
MSLMEEARAGTATDRLRQVAAAEKVPVEWLREAVARGAACLLYSRGHALERPCAVGAGLRVKVNANLGTSADLCRPEAELEKLRAALETGADAVMDLSTGGDLRAVRGAVRRHCPVPLGSVPVYEAAARLLGEGRSPCEMTGDDMLDAVRLHAEDGVDFVTVHSGLTLRGIEHLEAERRLAGVVSRGGSLLAHWMRFHERENPYYERFDELLEIARERELTLSLGDGLRPGCLSDAGDRAQVEELYTLGALVLRAREAGVQAMVEGPGHVPLADVAAQVRLEKVACHDAPFYVLGPLVTDVAPGYDHIAGAIGGAVAAAAGAGVRCYVTPAAPLRRPPPPGGRGGGFGSRNA